MPHPTRSATAARAGATSRLVVLRSGATVRVRPFRPGDDVDLVPRLDALLQQTGTRAAEASSTLLAVGVDAPVELAGAACYRLTDPQGRDAEVAVAVDVACRRQGLGTALFALLADDARRREVRVLKATAHLDDLDVRRLGADLGMASDLDVGGRYSVEFPIPDDPSALPDTAAADVYRIAAEGGDVDLRIGWTRSQPPELYLG